MSQRAAWQLEQLGFTNVHDFVVGKAHWLASRRPTVRAAPIDRVGDHLRTDAAAVTLPATVDDAIRQLDAAEGERVVVLNAAGVVLGSTRRNALTGHDPDTPIEHVMTIGPTTIRPDEESVAVRQRMSKHNVQSLIVTTPAGELLGLFDQTDTID